MSAANGPKNGPESEPTKETMLPHMALMVEKLQSRMMKLIHVMTMMDQSIAKRTHGLNQTHNVQTLRQGRVINKERRRTQKRMKKMRRLHMIFKHDVNLLLKRYTTLFKQATQVLTYLRSDSVPTPLPPGVIADANSLAEFYVRYNQLYHKIHEENEALHRMRRGENAGSNENSNENSTNNEESSPNVQFAPPTFHAIPHRMDAESMYLPAAMPAAIAASSSGGTRKRTLRKRTLRERTLRERTLRKKHIRRHQTRRRS